MSGPTKATKCPRCGQPASIERVNDKTLDREGDATEYAVHHLEPSECRNFVTNKV